MTLPAQQLTEHVTLMLLYYETLQSARYCLIQLNAAPALPKSLVCMTLALTTRDYGNPASQHCNEHHVVT